MYKRNLKLSPPWETIHNKLIAFFDGDNTIIVDKNITDDYTLGISCYSKDKYDALSRLLRKEYNFGNVTLKINLYLLADKDSRSSNKNDKVYYAIEDLETILTGNEIFNRVENIKLMGGTISYCIFNKQVIQFYNDDLTDINGLESTLAEHIAMEIFKTEDTDVYYCTNNM